jgi:hypothetical protein
MLLLEARRAIAVPGANLAVPATRGLTFDVRGGPLAGRPLDGGVRHQRHGAASAGLQNSSSHVAWPSSGSTAVAMMLTSFALDSAG